jgi:hypothetical protein
MQKLSKFPKYFQNKCKNFPLHIDIVQEISYKLLYKLINS